MVRAIVAGTKTQTRRAIKARGIFVSSGAIDGCGVVSMDDGDIREVRCPYGQPGDRLWVREAWRTVAEADATKPRNLDDAAYRFWYEADAPHQPGFGKLRPSMFMPRSASRITLEITDVRVERLQDISRGEAMAEGCPFPNLAHGDPRQWYAELWESINGPASWDADPWVWVVEFRRA